MAMDSQQALLALKGDVDELRMPLLRDTERLRLLRRVQNLVLTMDERMLKEALLHKGEIKFGKTFHSLKGRF